MKVLSLFWIFFISINGYKNEIIFKQEQNYCLITSFYSDNGKQYIEVDYIQYFTGDKAIEEAKKRGDADKFVIDGKKKYSITNDIYIVNDNSKLRKLKLSENVKINLVNSDDMKGNDTKDILEYLKENYKNKVFLVLLDETKVVEIKEIFTP